MREPGFWYRPRSLQSQFLKPLGAIYGAVASRRLRRKGIHAGIPVLCVGSYHLGGAGKTPTVLALTELLRELGENPVVLSRGYGGRLKGPLIVERRRHGAADVGDEPLMMAPHVRVAVARDRVAGVALAKSQGASVIVMDDGFQNPAVAKDVCFVVIDGERGTGNGEVFPAGPLRAPIEPQLRRTDALIVIGQGHAADGIATGLAARGKPVLRAHLVPDAESIAQLLSRRVFAFAGIGDPERFFRTLRACKIEVARTRAFPDHHRLSRQEIDQLLSEAARENLALVTTEKDLARLREAEGLPDWAKDIMALPVKLEFDDPALLRKSVSAALAAARAGT